MINPKMMGYSGYAINAVSIFIDVIIILLKNKLFTMKIWRKKKN